MQAGNLFGARSECRTVDVMSEINRNRKWVYVTTVCVGYYRTGGRTEERMVMSFCHQTV